MSETGNMDIDYVADLARVALSDEEKAKFSTQLDSIIGYVEKLNELETGNVEPLAHPFSRENVWQEDEVKGSLSTEDALKNAPAQRSNMIIVPKVVD